MKLLNNPVIYLTRQMWKFSKGNRKNVALFFVMFIIANCILFLEPLIFGKVLNIIQTDGITEDSIRNIIFTLALFVVVDIVFWFFHGPARYLEMCNAFLVRKNAKQHLLNGTIGLPSEWHTDHHSGDTIDKIEKATTALYEYSGHTFEVTQTIVRFVSSYIALIYFNIHASYIVLVMLIWIIALILKFDRILTKQWSELHRAENSIAAKIYDVISNITTVIILRIENVVQTSIAKKMMQPFALHKRSRRVDETKWFFVSVSAVVMLFLVLASYIYSHYHAGTPILIGSLYILYGYVQRINDLFFQFAYQYNLIVRQKVAVQNVEIITNEFEKGKPVRELPVPSRWKELQISSLRFSYQSREGGDQHLDDVSVTLRRREKIALIGESGSGKTTFLKIMRGLYEPQHLSLSLDAKKLPHGFQSIRSQIALIPQDPEIFNTTIKENITVGVEHSMTFIKRFATMARFIDVAEKLPKKWESSIVEKGVNLSGGQKQRLALARGLLAGVDKEILLLDEPTSSVDAKNERLIYQNIFTKFKSKTILSTIHRLHLLPMFDRILFFDNGAIIAEGSFEELMQTSPEFRSLWQKYQGFTEFHLTDVA